MEIKLSKDVEASLIASIKRYASENFEIEIGDLQSSLFLEFCLKEIAPVAYNRAIQDAQVFLQERLLDLESVCYAPEFEYWPSLETKKARRPKK